MTKDTIISGIKEKYRRFLEKTCKGLYVKEKKFVKDFVKGIVISKSCILRRISQSLNESISLDDTAKRLRNHLSKPNLSKILSDNHLFNQCKKIKCDSVIVFDPSDIVKNYATKMENLSKIYDGSNNTTCNGYNVLDAISIDKNGDELNISPLISDLHSNTEDPGALKQKLFDRINDIQVYSGNKGIFAMDRGYDDRKTFAYLDENEASFVIRAKGKRKLIHKGKELDFIEVAKKVKLKNVFKTGKTKIKVGAIKVGIRTNPHPRKKPDIVNVYLVVGRYVGKNKDGFERDKGYFYLFCNFYKMDKNTSLEVIAEKALKIYRLRWKIEEVHRHIKQDYRWEDMQLMTWDRLKNLNTLLLLAVSFVYTMKEYRIELFYTYQNLMTNRKNKINKIIEFIYYKLALVATEIFREFREYIKLPYKGIYKKVVQMSFF